MLPSSGAAFIFNINSQGQSQNKKFKLEDNLSVTSAELIALLLSLKHTVGKIQSNLLFLTDCQKVITGLNSDMNTTDRPDLYEQILELCLKHHSDGYQISFLWIPSHKNIFFNEAVDKLAKDARTDTKHFTRFGLGSKEIKKSNRATIYPENSEKEL